MQIKLKLKGNNTIVLNGVKLFCNCNFLSSLESPQTATFNLAAAELRSTTLLITAGPTPLRNHPLSSPRAALQAVHVRGDQSVLLVHSLSRFQAGRTQSRREAMSRHQITICLRGITSVLFHGNTKSLSV